MYIDIDKGLVYNLYRLVGSLMENIINTKEKILRSALELFTLRNYNSVGVQEIASHAGIKKGTFYHHYPSKRELTLNAIDTIWEIYKNDILDPVFNTDEPILDKFENLIEEFYDYHLTRKEESGFMTGCRLGNLALELSTQDEEIRDKVEEKFSKWFEYFAEKLKTAVESGELPKNIDVQKTAKAMLSYIEGTALFGKLYNEPEFMQILKKGMRKLVFEE